MIRLTHASAIRLFEWFRSCSAGWSRLQEHYQDPTIRVEAIARGVMGLSHGILGRKVEGRVLITQTMQNKFAFVVYVGVDLVREVAVAVVLGETHVVRGSPNPDVFAVDLPWN